MKTGAKYGLVTGSKQCQVCTVNFQTGLEMAGIRIGTIDSLRRDTDSSPLRDDVFP